MMQFYYLMVPQMVLQTVLMITNRNKAGMFRGDQGDYDQFNYWLAGLIDGGFYFNESGVVSFELTLDSKDEATLYFIINILGYGNVGKRTGVNAHRIRTAETLCVIDLLKRVNGKLLTIDKQIQLRNVCSHYNIPCIIPSFMDSLSIIRNTAWLSGFFDAEGSLIIFNEVTLVMSIPQKNIVGPKVFYRLF